LDPEAVERLKKESLSLPDLVQKVIEGRYED